MSQGRSAVDLLTNRKRRIAIHEAGHVVVGNELGLGFDLVELGHARALTHVSSMTGRDRTELGDGDSKLGKLLEWEARAVLAMGGFAAVALGTGDLDDGVEGAAEDRRLARKYMRRVWHSRGNKDIQLTNLHDAATQILEDRWEDVERLADGIVANNNLVLDRIEQIIGRPRRPGRSHLPHGERTVVGAREALLAQRSNRHVT